MFEGQRFAILAMFFFWGGVYLHVKYEKDNPIKRSGELTQLCTNTDADHVCPKFRNAQFFFIFYCYKRKCFCSHIPQVSLKKNQIILNTLLTNYKCG